ncbi:hypothetical protein NPIL_617961, partial [Nephila pilipes]
LSIALRGGTFCYLVSIPMPSDTPLHVQETCPERFESFPGRTTMITDE